jgi:methionyl-tRNA formyltransferase
MHRISEGIDDGPVMFRSDFNFDCGERFPFDYEARQLREDKVRLLPWLRSVLDRKVELQPIDRIHDQSRAWTSYFPRLHTDFHGLIDWSLEVEEIERLVLAFSKPYSGASTFIDSGRIRIFDARPVRVCPVHPFLVGLIVSASDHSLIVACRGGFLEIKRSELQMERAEHRLRVGDRFYTPVALLERAMSSRAYVSPKGSSLRWFAPSPARWNDFSE